MKKILISTFAFATTIVACNKGDGGNNIPTPTPTVTLPQWSQMPTATPSIIDYGKTTTVSASSSNATSITIRTSDGTVVATGRNSVSYTSPLLIANTTYIVSASNTKGTRIDSTRVIVTYDSVIAALTIGGWHLSNILVNGVSSGINPCLADDMNFFYLDKSTYVNRGTNHCDPLESNGPQGTWSLSDDKRKFTWGQIYDVDTLNSSTFRISADVPAFPSGTSRFTEIFRR